MKEPESSWTTLPQPNRDQGRNALSPPHHRTARVESAPSLRRLVNCQSEAHRSSLMAELLQNSVQLSMRQLPLTTEFNPSLNHFTDLRLRWMIYVC